jgi:hypothetical protein
MGVKVAKKQFLERSSLTLLKKQGCSIERRKKASGDHGQDGVSPG